MEEKYPISLLSKSTVALALPKEFIRRNYLQVGKSKVTHTITIITTLI
jgi:hypothetical protein